MSAGVRTRTSIGREDCWKRIDVGVSQRGLSRLINADMAVARVRWVADTGQRLAIFFRSSFLTEAQG